MTNDYKDSLAPRRGYWMQTYTGKQFFPQDPRPEDFCIEDIAHALSIENRFGGHLPKPYSVAQHSVVVYQIVKYALGSVPEGDSNRINILRWALFHDAPEAYVKDIPRPLKKALGDCYSAIEKSTLEALQNALGFFGPMPDVVKRADEIALATEKRDLFPASNNRWTLLESPAEGITIFYMPWYAAKSSFMAAYKELYR